MALRNAQAAGGPASVAPAELTTPAELAATWLGSALAAVPRLAAAGRPSCATTGAATTTAPSARRPAAAATCVRPYPSPRLHHPRFPFDGLALRCAQVGRRQALDDERAAGAQHAEALARRLRALGDAEVPGAVDVEDGGERAVLEGQGRSIRQHLRELDGEARQRTSAKIAFR